MLIIMFAIFPVLMTSIIISCIISALILSTILPNDIDDEFISKLIENNTYILFGFVITWIVLTVYFYNILTGLF